MENDGFTGPRETIIEVMYLENEREFIASARGIIGCTARGATPEQAITGVKLLLKQSG